MGGGWGEREDKETWRGRERKEGLWEVKQG